MGGTMKNRIIVTIGWISVILPQITVIQSIINDQEAYNHCLTDNNAFIAIIWPIAQGKETAIKKILNRYGKILYHKPFYFDKLSAYKILHYAHQHIPNGQPHCGSLKEHVKWYFPKGTYKNQASIYLLWFERSSDAISCKRTIRMLFPQLQYRSIHINDYHAETIQLAKFFFMAHDS